MSQNLIQSSPYRDEIDLLKIIKVLLESKKFIFLTTLIFIIASIIYSLSLKPSFKTSAILEIGYVELNNGDRELIESTSDLISELQVLILKNPDRKFSQKVSMNSFEGRVINFNTTSSSTEQNEILLTEIISYIDERHSNLSLAKKNIKKDQISLNLERVNSQIGFIKEKQLSDIQDRLDIVSSELPIIDLEISQLENVILLDTHNLSLLKENDNLLRVRAANSPTLEQIIFTYESKLIALNRKKASYILETKTLNNKLENVFIQSEELFNLKQKQKTLENELQTLISQIQYNTRSIGDIQTNTLKPKTQLIISLGIILGFVTSILVVFIRYSIKSFKEIKA